MLPLAVFDGLELCLFRKVGRIQGSVSECHHTERVALTGRAGAFA